MELKYSIPLKQRRGPMSWTRIIKNYLNYARDQEKYTYLHEILRAEYGAELDDDYTVVVFPSEEIKAEFLLKWS